jgi:hypothetical protein
MIAEKRDELPTGSAGFVLPGLNRVENRAIVVASIDLVARLHDDEVSRTQRPSASIAPASRKALFA